MAIRQHLVDDKIAYIEAGSIRSIEVNNDQKAWDIISN